MRALKANKEELEEESTIVPEQLTALETYLSTSAIAIKPTNKFN